jgi:cytosine/adenosine deaminase-related metal-dependent hydrolase
MAYLKFKADKLFDGYCFKDADSVLITDEAGVIQEIVPEIDAGDGIQQFSGIIAPGLINCHCHLELSHLKNCIPPNTGLIEFLCSVVLKREASPNPSEGGAIEDHEKKKLQALIDAEKEMYENGIVAVGDIGNTADTAQVKSKSKIRWQNFVEVLSFTDEKADESIRHYKKVAEVFEETLGTSAIPHRTALVPHAPYTISPETFKQLNLLTRNQIISIHNQEHPAENVLYKTGGGEYLKLFKIFGLDKSPFPVTGKNSIQSVLPYFNNGQTILLIHNTCMQQEDVDWANEYAAANGLTLVYCLCFNANLYIENKVPPADILMKNNCHIVLGTDSYSSNWQLSIAKEMQALHKHFPEIPMETILQWATSNGAKALGWGDELGAFKKGTTPGLVVIDNNLEASKRLA